VTKSCDQGNSCIVIGGEELAGPMPLYTRPQMDENMTCNPTCHEMGKDSWSPGFCNETTSKGCLAGFLG
jgi:hypothetical protein